MKSNNKGFALIESIVTVAIIAILLSMVGLAFTSIIHYMSESALIKNTSNEIFAKIQNDESTIEKESTMTFKDGLSVQGKMKIVTKKYNDKDELSLSLFSIGEVQRTYNEDANFYLLKDPTKKNNNNIDVNSDTLCINEPDKLSPHKNAVLSGTQSSRQIDYIQSHVKLPSKNSTNVSINIDSILGGNHYGGVTFEDATINWYRIDKIDGAPYNIYGYIEPYDINDGTVKNVEIIFKKNGSLGHIEPELVLYNFNLPNGFTDEILYYIKNHFGFYATGNDLSGEYYLQCNKLFNGEPFEFGRLKGYSIFNYLNDGDEIVINIIPKKTN
ncbi:pilus assembly FimT family protein [Candidatus Stoquefichus massiliensis]|uniref:pilus assembly FimT family protein n=1 Tax=Candidatus Stoquefichus massiliensis TaxID=1470350 RepID=UPI000488FF70|nr:prepilin-type N-terminal cleavage/methylation domain-containing protein [Candidatus Stoquefichus massiliensis]